MEAVPYNDLKNNGKFSQVAGAAKISTWQQFVLLTVLQARCGLVISKVYASSACEMLRRQVTLTMAGGFLCE